MGIVTCQFGHSTSICTTGEDLARKKITTSTTNCDRLSAVTVRIQSIGCELWHGFDLNLHRRHLIHIYILATQVKTTVLLLVNLFYLQSENRPIMPIMSCDLANKHDFLPRFRYNSSKINIMQLLIIIRLISLVQHKLILINLSGKSKWLGIHTWWVTQRD